MTENQQAGLVRRNFLKGLGTKGLGAAALGLAAMEPSKLLALVSAKDTVAEIFTAALIAEDLVTTFYYNGLVGHVIDDPALAGSGGFIASDGNPVVTNGNFANVRIIQAALSEEIAHANLFRTLLDMPSSVTDPYQMFYFPAGTFDSINPFLATLDALENTLIGLYLVAIRELSKLAVKPQGTRHTSAQLTYFAVLAASVLGVESEHRVLGRVIGRVTPANERNFEQYAGLKKVFKGSKSALEALSPFFTSSTGPGYSLETALANQGSVSIPTEFGPPSKSGQEDDEEE